MKYSNFLPISVPLYSLRVSSLVVFPSRFFLLFTSFTSPQLSLPLSLYPISAYQWRNYNFCPPANIRYTGPSAPLNLGPPLPFWAPGSPDIAGAADG